MSNENGDMPAMPNGESVGGMVVTTGGLTKREAFAMEAMAAFITADHANGSEKRLNEDNALMAVDAADALLAELESGK